MGKNKGQIKPKAIRSIKVVTKHSKVLYCIVRDCACKTVGEAFEKWNSPSTEGCN